MSKLEGGIDLEFQKVDVTDDDKKPINLDGTDGSFF